MTTLTLPALRGVQAGRPFYAVMTTVAQALTMFAPIDGKLPPEERAQRELRKARVPGIAEYVVQHPTSWVFSSLVAAVDEDVSFVPYASHKSNVVGSVPGTLTLKVLAYLLDGQHRRAGLEEAARRLKDAAAGLLGENLTVLIYPNRKLVEQQAMFAKLNGTPQLPNKSLCMLYDPNETTAVVKAVIAGVPVFKALTDGQATSCSGKNPKLFAFKSLSAATEALLSGSEGEPAALRALAVAYWSAIAGAVPGWAEAAAGREDSAPHLLRQRVVHAHGVVLQALGVFGRGLLANHREDWRTKLAGLEAVPWSREAPVWQGRCMLGPKMVINAKAVQLTANVFNQTLDMPLSLDGRKAEAGLAGQG